MLKEIQETDTAIWCNMKKLTVALNLELVNYPAMQLVRKRVYLLIAILLFFLNWFSGLVISICTPFRDPHKAFKGVVCIDGRMSDILTNVTNISPGLDAYSFIIDRQGRVIHHHNLAKPSNTKTSLNVNISMIESGEELQEIISQMLAWVLLIDCWKG